MSQSFKAALRSALTTNEPVSRQYYASRLQPYAGQQLNRSYAAHSKQTRSRKYETSTSVDGPGHYSMDQGHGTGQSFQEATNISTEERIEALYKRILKLRDKKLCTIRSLKAETRNSPAPGTTKQEVEMLHSKEHKPNVDHKTGALSRPNSSITLKMEHNPCQTMHSQEFEETKSFARHQFQSRPILSSYMKSQLQEAVPDHKASRDSSRVPDTVTNKAIGVQQPYVSPHSRPAVQEGASRIRPTRILDMKVSLYKYTTPDSQSPPLMDAQVRGNRLSSIQQASIPTFGVDRRAPPRLRLEIPSTSPNQSFLSKASSVPKNVPESSSRNPPSHVMTPQHSEQASKTVSFAEIRQRLQQESQNASKFVASKQHSLRKYSEVVATSKHDEYDMARPDHRVAYYTPSSLVATEHHAGSIPNSVQTKGWDLKSSQTNKPSGDYPTKAVDKAYTENIKVFEHNPFQIGEDSGVKSHTRTNLYSSENEPTVYQQSNQMPTPQRPSSKRMHLTRIYSDESRDPNTACLKSEKSTLLELKKFIEKRIKLIDEHEVLGAFQSQASHQLPNHCRSQLCSRSPPPLLYCDEVQLKGHGGRPKTNLLVDSSSQITRLHEHHQLPSGANTPATVKPYKYRPSSSKENGKHLRNSNGKITPSVNSAEGGSRTADSDHSQRGKRQVKDLETNSDSRPADKVVEPSYRSRDSGAVQEEDSRSQATQLEYLLPSHEEQLLGQNRLTLGKGVSGTKGFGQEVSADALACLTVGNLHCEIKEEPQPLANTKKWDESTQLYLKSIKEKSKMLTDTINFGSQKYSNYQVGASKQCPAGLSMKRAGQGPYIVLPIHSAVSSTGSERKNPEWTTPQFTKRSHKPGQELEGGTEDYQDKRSRSSKIQILNDRSPPDTNHSRGMAESVLSQTSSTGREIASTPSEENIKQFISKYYRR